MRLTGSSCCAFRWAGATARNRSPTRSFFCAHRSRAKLTGKCSARTTAGESGTAYEDRAGTVPAHADPGILRFCAAGGLHACGHPSGGLLPARLLESREQSAYGREIRTVGSGGRSGKIVDGGWNQKNSQGKRGCGPDAGGGPKRAQQIEKVKTIVRRIGEAGVPVLGYNFSLGGVCGRVTAAAGRGAAVTLGMDGPAEDVPIPNGTIWNMVYDQDAARGTLASISHEELWKRLQRFLEEIIPVAEESGVRLAAHPDDPPMPTMRQQPRLVYQPRMYQKLIDLVPSSSNMLELCVGTLAEMTEDNIYEAIDSYSRQNKIAYIHLRNVEGQVPHYRETFIDEGEVDMPRILGILQRNHFDGVMIPDHTPQMTCAAPWHAGMAHTLGYMLAAKAMLESATDGNGGKSLAASGDK